MEPTPQKRLAWGRAVKLALLALLGTDVVWLLWDYAATLIVWGSAPGYWYYGSWISMPIVYMLFQIPAIAAVCFYQLAIGRFHSSSTALWAYPLVSAASLVAAGIAAGMNLDQPFYFLALVLLPRTATYGLVFAMLRHRALRATDAAPALSRTA